MTLDNIDLFLPTLEQHKDDPILIVVHKDPDLDAIGSATALALQLDQQGYTCKIWITERIPTDHLFLPGLDFVERKYPKSFNEKLIICLDSSHYERIRDNENLDITTPLLNIDHHSDNSFFGSSNIVWEMSSVGEMLATLFMHVGWEITPEIATCLYAAIIFDTGQFSYSNTTPHTFKIASELVAKNIEHHKIIETLTENKTPAYFQQIQNALDNMIYNEDSKVIYTTLPYCKENAGNDIINFIRQRKKTNVCLVFRNTQSNIVKISLRSKTDFDVAKFAAKFGGGGHKKAAGIQMEGDIDDIKKQVISELENELLR